jgi:hypothetical protein
VVNLDPTLVEQFFDAAMREPVPQIPAHRDDDVHALPADRRARFVRLLT